MIQCVFAMAALRRAHSEETLIERALDGSVAAQRMLARRLLPVICAHTRRALSRQIGIADQDGHDIVQSVWIVLLDNDGRQLRAYDPDRGASLEHYVGMIAQRTVSNVIRNRYAEKRGGGQIPAPLDEARAISDSVGGPEAATEARDLATALQAHLKSTLSARGQVVYNLLYIDEEPVERVAVLLGVKRSVIYNWQHRIRAAAREFVEKRSG